MRRSMPSVLFATLCLASLHLVDSQSQSLSTCQGGYCHTADEWTSMMVSLQKDVRQRERDFAKRMENCTVCWSSPCKNGGTCMPVDDSTYTCECPDDTNGTNCENKLTCQSNSCGVNAVCYVGNHRINCNCIAGFSGDPFVACSFRQVCASIAGDPHYSTFDRLSYAYHGTCPYVLCEPQPSADIGQYDRFRVTSDNLRVSLTSFVSYAKSLNVTYYNQTIGVNNVDYNVRVNGIITAAPYMWPNNVTWQIRVTKPSSTYFVIESDQKITVTLSYQTVQVCIPVVPEFTGRGQLWGLFGNYDNNCTDDMLLGDGSNTSLSVPSNCVQSDDRISAVFGDSYIVPAYQLANPYCVSGQILANGTTQCNFNELAGQLCQPIFLAQTGQGPFAQCQAMSDLQQAYQNCIYDYCATQDICSILSEFARSCQNQLPGTDLGHWRPNLNLTNGVRCSEPYCGLTAEWNTCADQCPATCADHDGSTQCPLPCVEGCTCLPGYVNDNTDPAMPCIRVQACGCEAADGVWHPADQPWYTNNCTTSSICTNGTASSESWQCDLHATCDNVDGVMECVCGPGWNGTGDYCEDINECLDPATCGQAEGHGSCTNTPGSYYCNCSQYYHGFKCDVYLPRRHCADLKRYFNLSSDGPTTIAPPYDTVGYAAYVERPVYCINSNNSGIGDGRGGYTVVNYFEANGSAGWTYEQYTAGFGNVPAGNYWTGLSLMSGMTRLDQTSMYLLIEDCTNRTFNCVYPSFIIGSSSDRFPLIISEMCTGTAFDTYDGEHDPLVPWLPEGNFTYPFAAIPDPAAVEELDTGFWYGRVQYSNLNGIRDNCMRLPGYLKYGIRYYKQAQMFLRPLGYWDSA